VNSIIDAAGKAVIAQVDVTSAESVEIFLKGAEARWGQLGSIVLASGPKIPIRPIVDVSEEIFCSVIEIEVIGGFNIIKKGIPLLWR
jgi:NAD(P)-dependent dehydrogenase (short-subunit alcohol dehydrogenase family)